MEPTTEITKKLQDSLMTISSSGNIKDLDLSLVTSLETFISNFKQCIIFSSTPATLPTNLQCHLYDNVPLPSFIQEMIVGSVECRLADDEVSTFFSSLKSQQQQQPLLQQQPYSKFLVRCFPIFDNSHLVSVIAILCTTNFCPDQPCLHLLFQQYICQYGNLRELELERKKLRDREKLLHLCGCDYPHHTDVTALELKISQHMIDLTNSEWGCLLFLHQHHLHTHVINGTVLDNEIKLSVKNNELESAINQKRKMELRTLMNLSPSSFFDTWPCNIHSHLILPLHHHPSHSTTTNCSCGGCCENAGESCGGGCGCKCHGDSKIGGGDCKDGGSGNGRCGSGDCEGCSQEKVEGLVMLFNKRSSTKYTQQDEDSLQECFKHISPHLLTSVNLQHNILLSNQRKRLLQLAKNIFTNLEDVDDLLKRVMKESMAVSKAERCSIFLLDHTTNELVVSVFDFHDESHGHRNLHIPSNKGVTGHVIKTGRVTWVKDCRKASMFCKDVDDPLLIQPNNLLCFPIKTETDEILGVVHLYNREGGWDDGDVDGGGDDDDDGLVKTISEFCSISIGHSLMYKKSLDAQHRVGVSNEMMLYHMKVPQDEITCLLASTDHPPPHPHFETFSFIPRLIHVQDMPYVILDMMTQLDFINTFKLHTPTLVRFILMVKKGYRDPSYHNFSHAFAVLHFCFLLFKNTHLTTLLNDLEQLALFISCLCHDIDHRGTTNSFHIASGSSLAALYSSNGSILESHHFAQTVCILNTEGCNIVEGLSRDDYKKFLDLVQDIILATDIVQHIKKTQRMKTLFKNGFVARNSEEKKLLLSLLMTSCDLSDQTKSFHNSKNIASLIYTEFFCQGDLEKQMGVTPSEMMDRDRAKIPDIQVRFLKELAMPVYKMLSDLLPQTTEVYERLMENYREWSEMGKLGENLEIPINHVISPSQSLPNFNYLLKHNTHNRHNNCYNHRHTAYNRSVSSNTTNTQDVVLSIAPCTDNSNAFTLPTNTTTQSTIL